MKPIKASWVAIAGIADLIIIAILLIMLVGCTSTSPTAPAEAVLCADTTTADGVTCVTVVERG